MTRLYTEDAFSGGGSSSVVPYELSVGNVYFSNHSNRVVEPKRPLLGY